MLSHKQLLMKRAAKKARNLNRRKLWRDRHPGHKSLQAPTRRGYGARWKAGTKIRGNKSSLHKRGIVQR